MNIKKCDGGHFYNADKYTECPHCKEKTMDNKNNISTYASPQNSLNTNNDVAATVAYNTTYNEFKFPSESAVQSLPPTGDHSYVANDMQSRGMIVGWLIGVAGPYYGRACTLYTSDTVVEGVVFSFDMYSKSFVLNYTLSHSDVMVNNKYVVENEFLHYMDRIFINGTEYMLVTLCKDGFSWWQTVPYHTTEKDTHKKPSFTYVEQNYNAALSDAVVQNPASENNYEEPATSVLVSNTWRCLCCNAENTEMVSVCRLCNSSRW